MFRQLGVVGCGLMGGSFALALRRAGGVQRVVGCSQSPATTQRALELGVIDAAAASPAQAAAGSDLVLVAVPVAATEQALRSLRDSLGPGTLCMDVGSTKADVVAAARRALGERAACFVPAHPIAGKETAGVQHADAALYQGRDVILTPMPETDAGLLDKAALTWRALGSRVRTLTPEAHDRAFAAVSHLPHLLAYAYVLAVEQAPGGAEHLSLAGPGFRDFTRIAGADPDVWRDILMANAEAVLAASGHFRHHLDTMEQALRAGDAASVERCIRAASAGRRAWGAASGGSPVPET